MLVILYYAVRDFSHEGSVAPLFLMHMGEATLNANLEPASQYKNR